MIDWHAAREEVTGYLQDLIRLDTTNPPGNETAAARYLEEILRREGFEPMLVESEPGRGNVLATLPGGCASFRSTGSIVFRAISSSSAASSSSSWPSCAWASTAPPRQQRGGRRVPTRARRG